MSAISRALVVQPADSGQKLTDAILELVVRVPGTDEHLSRHPHARAQAIARSAARQASMVAASMSLPPGFLGWLTLLPELLAVWRLQAQMVSDIAGVYGKSAQLNREPLLSKTA
jgi:hypothetical protein